MKTKLFLHMGPGYHSDVERELLGAAYPEVEFWNQPHVKTYSDLVAATGDKIIQMVQTAKRPIILIGHSFGGTIAFEALLENSKNVSELRLLNSAFDPFECFINLAMRLFPSEVGDLDSLRKSTKEEKIQFIIKVASAPQFSDLYWQSPQRRDELGPLLKRVSGLNPEIFISNFSSYLQSAKSQKTNSDFNGPVTLYYSSADVLLQRSKDIDPWKTRFKNAQIVEFSLGGHHPHLEDIAGTKALFKS